MKPRNEVQITLSTEERDALDEHILRMASTLPEELGRFTSERVIRQALREFLRARGLVIQEPSEGP